MGIWPVVAPPGKWFLAAWGRFRPIHWLVPFLQLQPARVAKRVPSHPPKIFRSF